MTRYVIGKYCNDRNNNFDVIRVMAAIMVIFSHSFPLSGSTYEPLLVITKGQMTFGSVGVAIFFMVSGFLVSQSWDRNKNIFKFLRKRALRLLPGLSVVVVITVFIIGPILTALSIKDYFYNALTYDYLNNILLYKTSFILPGVFNELPYPKSVNGSLWTLTYEARCYISLAILGTLGLFSNKKIILCLFVLLYVHIQIIDRHVIEIWYLSVYFYFGVLVYVFRSNIILKKRYMIVSVALLIFFAFIGYGFRNIFIICGGYLIFYLAFNSEIKFYNFAKYGDLSYGLYIYAFLIQQIIMSKFPWLYLNPVGLFWRALIITLIIAFISWHLIEKTCLKYK